MRSHADDLGSIPEDIIWRVQIIVWGIKVIKNLFILVLCVLYVFYSESLFDGLLIDLYYFPNNRFDKSDFMLVPNGTQRNAINCLNVILF